MDPHRIGEKFQRWTILNKDDPRAWKRRVICRCDCGTIRSLYLNVVVNGLTHSCGCYKRERTSQVKFKHGHSGCNFRDVERSPEYNVWSRMKQRCLVPAHRLYYLYGGRGIKICPEWVDDFMAFLRDIGPRPSAKHSIDRIDVNGNYEPGNVRWATMKDQGRNKQRTLKVHFRGTIMSLMEACELTGLKGWSVMNPIYKKGYNPQEALEYALNRKGYTGQR